jgi:hypothetical protein
MRKITLIVCVLGLVIAASARGSQTLLVGTTLSTSSYSGYNVTSTQALAQQFVLDLPATATSVTFELGGSYKFNSDGAFAGIGANVPIRAQITSGLGSGSTILADKTVTFKSLKKSLYATTLTVPLNQQTLDAGTYYLVLSTTNDCSVGCVAWNSGPELDTSYGHLGSAFYANPTGYNNPNEATFIPATFAPQVLQFQLVGKPR